MRPRGESTFLKKPSTLSFVKLDGIIWIRKINLSIYMLVELSFGLL